jgi:hypothetical protein
MLRRLPAVALGALLFAATLTGCGSSATSSPVSGTAASTLKHVAPPQTLPADAVKYLPSSVKALSVRFLARESGAPQLTARLPAWGYLIGADRYFQGESHKLQVVDSRTLRFRTAAGATSFVEFMRGHLLTYIGSMPRIRRFSTLGRTGILATGQPCACHLAEPTLLAIVARGPTVTWLEINGPSATSGGLDSLIARAP